MKSGPEGAALSDEVNPNEAYVKATVSAEQGGPHAGEVVEILADDYASKGDEEMIEVKVGDDVIFMEKKHIKIGAAAMEKPEEVKDMDAEEKPTVESDDDNLDVSFSDDEDSEDDIVTVDDLDLDDEEDDEEYEDESEIDTEIPEPKSDIEMLRSKLKKSLAELEEIKADMHSSFTSTDTIGSTITSIKGMLDALKQDQMNILSKK